MEGFGQTFTAQDEEDIKIKIGQATECLEYYLRANRDLATMTTKQNEKLKTMMFTQKRAQDQNVLNAVFQKNKTQRRTLIDGMRLEYTAGNGKLRNRIKKIDKFTNAITYGSEKIPKGTQVAPVDPGARSTARVPAASYSDLTSPPKIQSGGWDSGDHIVVLACTCKVPYKMPPLAERILKKDRNEVSLDMLDGDEKPSKKGKKGKASAAASAFVQAAEEG